MRKPILVAIRFHELHLGRGQGKASLAMEEGLVANSRYLVLFVGVNEFRQDAPNRPHVDGRVIVRVKKNDLWGSIEPCDHMEGQLIGLSFLLLDLLELFNFFLLLVFYLFV